MSGEQNRLREITEKMSIIAQIKLLHSSAPRAGKGTRTIVSTYLSHFELSSFEIVHEQNFSIIEIQFGICNQCEANNITCLQSVMSFAMMQSYRTILYAAYVIQRAAAIGHYV